MLHNSMKTNVQTEYKIGSLIGKGASGSVYQALSKSTGKTVAIKRIKHLSLHKLNETMSEIDLLKQLRHLNIVHLYGYERTNTDLLIIMEYCESGSLLETIKKFGNIPEILVSGYMDQVLIGLSYLHDQGIIHRDIKSANILTTKEGVVKLADFGIAMRFGIDRNVFEGSPYWMAPEVIELSGSNCSSDIWSVGCTALELYTGKPPYYDLEPISALFRIVSADTIPYPDSITPLFRDFLNECFQKDPNLRISANRLQKHPWINSFKKETNNQYIAKRVRNFSVQKILDLNVFRDVEESDDYSQDFIELENTITLKTQPIQNNEPSDPLYEISNEVMETNYSVSWTDYLAQYINSKITMSELQPIIEHSLSQSKIMHLLGIVGNYRDNVDLKLLALRLINKFNGNHVIPPDVHFLALSTLIPKALPNHAQLIREIVTLICNTIEKYPESIITSQLHIIEQTLSSSNVDLKIKLIETLTKTIENQIGEDRNELRRFICDTTIPTLISKYLIYTRLPQISRDEPLVNSIIALLYELSQGNHYVLHKLGSEMLFQRLLKSLAMNQTASSIKLLKIIKNLCQVSDNLPMFDMSGAIEIICNLLWKPNEVVDIRTQVFSCLFYSLRLNSRRQERALRMGILKHLALSCSSNHPAKQFAVPILCDIVCHLTTETFWQENMLDILIKLLQDFCWRSVVLEAILSWISKEPSRVEDALLTSTKPVFQTIFLNPTPRYETENQIMSQLVRILSQNPKIGYLLLSDGIVLYLSRIGMIPSQQLTIDMLKIFFNLVRPNFNSYWKEHVKDYNLAMLTISKMQINNSVLVKQMVNNILEQLNKLRSSY